MEQQTATAEVLQVISGSMADAQPVLEKILESCSHLFYAQGMAVTLIGDDGMLHLSATRAIAKADAPEGWRTPEDAARIEAWSRSVFPMPLTGTGTAAAIASGRVLNYPDALNGADVPRGVQAAAKVAGLNYSQMMAPLMQGGRGIGAISLQRPALGGFSAKEQELLASFADQAVIAIQNARLFRETNEALERQTATAEILAVISESPTDVQPVFQAIAERARTLCEADVGATTRLEGDVVHLAGVRALSTQAEDAMRAAFPMAVAASPPNIRRAIVEQQPIQIADVHAEPGYPSAEVAQRSGFRSILSVPLLHQGRSIGTIGVARREPGRFADSAVALLQTFARQAVIAIENVRLFNETKEALERQTATAEVLEAIGSSVADTPRCSTRSSTAAGSSLPPPMSPYWSSTSRAGARGGGARHRRRRRCGAPAGGRWPEAAVEHAIRERQVCTTPTCSPTRRAPGAAHDGRMLGTGTSRTRSRRWCGRAAASGSSPWRAARVRLHGAGDRRCSRPSPTRR